VVEVVVETRAGGDKPVDDDRSV
jgi:hypothetical protein